MPPCTQASFAPSHSDQLATRKVPAGTAANGHLLLPSGSSRGSRLLAVALIVTHHVTLSCLLATSEHARLDEGSRTPSPPDS